jgi:hypothetical protein
VPGVDISGCFSHSGHMSFPFWHVVNVQGPCNKKMSPLFLRMATRFVPLVLGSPVFQRGAPEASQWEHSSCRCPWAKFSSSKPNAAVSWLRCQKETC